MDNKNDWEREVVRSLLSEQRKTFWSGLFFKSFFVIYILISTFVTVRAFDSFSETNQVDGVKHTAVIDVSGIIMDGTIASADNIITALRAAEANKDTAGIILRCNSPGGSPVQSDYIYREIKRIRDRNPSMPIHTVVSDMCASGGYYVASSTDHIFINPSSIIGSIGVITAGFGYTELMDTIGVERRVLTAGKNKSILDPFSPMTEDDEEITHKMMKAIHSEFINAVIKGRGGRLRTEKYSEELFSGVFWTGRRAVKLGIADGVGDVYTVSRDVIGTSNLVDFTVRPTVGQQLIRRFTTEAKNLFSTLTSYSISL